MTSVVKGLHQTEPRGPCRGAPSLPTRQQQRVRIIRLLSLGFQFHLAASPRGRGSPCSAPGLASDSNSHPASVGGVLALPFVFPRKPRPRGLERALQGHRSPSPPPAPAHLALPAPPAGRKGRVQGLLVIPPPAPGSRNESLLLSIPGEGCLWAGACGHELVSKGSHRPSTDATLGDIELPRDTWGQAAR